MSSSTGGRRTPLSSCRNNLASPPLGDTDRRAKSTVSVTRAGVVDPLICEPAAGVGWFCNATKAGIPPPDTELEVWVEMNGGVVLLDVLGASEG